MSGILDSLGSMITPDAVGSLAKSFGVDSSAISRGLGAAGPLLLGGMAKMAGTPGGAESLLKMLPQESSGLLGGLGNVGNMLSAMMGGGSAAAGGGMLSSLLGPGVNAIGATLSRTLGFNVTPLLAMAVPAIMGFVAKAVKAQNLDAAGLASLLTRENADFAGNPANKEAMALVAAATESGSKAAAMIASYGPDWSKVVAGPAAALFMVAATDPSGPLGAMKEAKAGGDAILDAAKHAAPTSVIAAALGSGLTPDMLHNLKSVAPTPDKLLDAVKAGAAAVAARSPAEAEAYRNTILAVAKATAEASKDGGFLGIGGKLVSDDEQAALDKIKAALG